MVIGCEICGDINCTKNCSWFDLDTDFTVEEIRDHEERFWDMYSKSSGIDRKTLNDLFGKQQLSE